MTNGEMMTLRLRRIDICYLSTATTSIIWDMKNEMRDPTTSEDRREILARSIEKWQELHDNIKAQFNAQDA